MRIKTWLSAVTLCLPMFFSSYAVSLAQDQDTAEATEKVASSDQAGEEDFEQLSKLLTDSVFEGHFTIDGNDTPPKKEQYFLKTVKKLPTADFWLIQTRIKYGDHDVTVPLSLPIKWAAKTPVITVDNVSIPGLGTFNARVLIADGKYSGTWQHGKVGGHLYGVIKQEESEEKEVSDADAADKSEAEAE